MCRGHLVRSRRKVWPIIGGPAVPFRKLRTIVSTSGNSGIDGDYTQHQMLSKIALLATDQIAYLVKLGRPYTGDFKQIFHFEE